jgi:hypothetical protein
LDVGWSLLLRWSLIINVSIVFVNEVNSLSGIVIYLIVKVVLAKALKFEDVGMRENFMGRSILAVLSDLDVGLIV